MQRFLLLLGEIKELESRGEYASLLQNTEGKPDLVFLTDFTEKLNHLNCERQGKGMTVSDMISAVITFEAKMNIFSLHLRERNCCSFTLCGQC